MSSIKLWHSEEMKQWRWTIVDDDLNMHSGQEPDIRDAMNKIAKTVKELEGFCEAKESITRTIMRVRWVFQG